MIRVHIGPPYHYLLGLGPILKRFSVIKNLKFFKKNLDAILGPK